MNTIFKSKFFLSYKPAFVVCVALLLLFSAVSIITAAPLMIEPDKVGIYLAYDGMNSGTNNDHTIQSFNELDFGFSFPIHGGNIGFKTSVNSNRSNSDYYYYEIFSSWMMGNNLMDLTLDRLDSNGSVLRWGLSRALPSNEENVMLSLGPGISLFKSDKNTTISLFLQGKMSCYITEGIFIYGTGLYDFNLNNSQYECGFGFTF